MKKVAVSFFLMLAFGTMHAQSIEDQDAVMGPVKMLFEAMQKGDSALLHKAFASQATLATVGRDKNGKPAISYEPLYDFLKVIGTPHAEVYNEMIWDEKILIDANFAQVWTSYAFYLGKKFSHCGVDAFHLIKSDDGNGKSFTWQTQDRRMGVKFHQKSASNLNN